MKRYKIFLIEINEYKYIIMQTLPSQIQDSVENDETNEKHKVKLTMSQEKPLDRVLLPMIPSLAQKLLQKKFFKKKLN